MKTEKQNQILERITQLADTADSAMMYGDWKGLHEVIQEEKIAAKTADALGLEEKDVEWAQRQGRINHNMRTHGWDHYYGDLDDDMERIA
jgi:hypothetical protein